MLVAAHNGCYRPHFAGMPALTVDDLKRSAREIDFWTSSCMVALEGDQPIAVLLACKRERETLIWRLGVHPEHQRRGHARHLLTSLSAKLAILGPPRLVAEVSQDDLRAAPLLEACGWTREVDYRDFVLHEPPARPSELIIPITVDELIANDALAPRASHPWARSTAALTARKAMLSGLAVASEARIEAWLLYDECPEDGTDRVRALGCADPSRWKPWLGLLVGQLGATASGAIRCERLRAEEVPFELLRALGFEAAGRTAGFVATARPG